MCAVGSALLFSFLVLAQRVQDMAGLLTSDVIDYARAIVRDNGYNVADTGVYQLYVNTPRDSLVRGYTTIHVLEHSHPIYIIMLNDSTGQTIDFNWCQVFDYPDLKPWQDRVLRATNAKPKTPQELAREVGCSDPKVLSKPVPIEKRR